MALVFDTTNKRIILDVASITATEIYSRWVDWLAVGDNAKYLPAFRSTGGDSLGSGISIPAYYFLTNGWRVRPMESNHTLTIDGNLFVDGGGDPVVSTLGNFNVLIKTIVPVQAQTVNVAGGGSGPTTSEIAQAIRVELEPELTHILQVPLTSSGLTTNQATMLLEMYDLLGLDPAKPLVVTSTNRSAGSISQHIVTDTSSTVVQRV